MGITTVVAMEITMGTIMNLGGAGHWFFLWLLVLWDSNPYKSRVYIHICTYFVYVIIWLYIYVYIYVYIYMYIYVCIYIYIFM